MTVECRAISVMLLDRANCKLIAVGSFFAVHGQKHLLVKYSVEL